MNNPDSEFYIEAFKSEECFCGRNKKSRMAFCYGCYKSLPHDMQKALYQRMGNGFEEAYEEAVKWLG